MKIFTFILLVFLGIGLQAQQLAQYSERMIDMMQFNPAYAGVKGNPEIILHHLTQWQNWEGAPVTQSVSINKMINRVQGIGFELLKDEIGPAKTLDLQLTYAHHINLGPLKLSLAEIGRAHV